MVNMAEKTKKIVKKKTDSSAKVKKPAPKTTVKKTTVKKPVSSATGKKKSVVKEAKYWRGVGRRKTAVARVRIEPSRDQGFLVNNKELKEYFILGSLCQIAVAPLKELGEEDRFKVSVIVKGGGVFAQAGAVRHGLSRALIKFEPSWRQKLKPLGFLTRDPRMKERKKFGLKKARKAPQWQKR